MSREGNVFLLEVQPKPLELEYLGDVHKLEESKKMPYISTAERFGIEKGREQALEQVAKQMIEEGLKLTLIKKTTGLSLAKIKTLQRSLKEEKH